MFQKAQEIPPDPMYNKHQRLQATTQARTSFCDSLGEKLSSIA